MERGARLVRNEYAEGQVEEGKKNDRVELPMPAKIAMEDRIPVEGVVKQRGNPRAANEC